MRLVVGDDSGDRWVEVEAASEVTLTSIAEALSLGRGDLAVDGVAADGGRRWLDGVLREGARLHQLSSDDDREAAVVDLVVSAGLDAGVRWRLRPGRYELGADPGAHIAAPTREGLIEVDRAGSVTIVTGRGEPIHVEHGEQALVGEHYWRCEAPLSVHAAPPDGGSVPTQPFNRPPRVLEPPLDLELHPPQLQSSMTSPPRMRWAMLVAPLLIGGVFAVLFNPMMAAFALFGPLMIGASYVEDRLRRRREQAASTLQFEAALARFETDVAGCASEETARLERMHPDLGTVVGRALSGSSRLWERRPAHDDFLRVAVGHGRMLHRPRLAASPGRLEPEVEDSLRIGGGIEHARIEISLEPGTAVGIVGDASVGRCALRSLVAQAAVHHGPVDLTVAVVTDRPGTWRWAVWLPHTAADAGFRAVASSPDEIDRLASLLAEAPGRRLLVVDHQSLSDSQRRWLRGQLGEGRTAVIEVAPTEEKLPSYVTTLIDVSGERADVRFPAQGRLVPAVKLDGLPEDVALDVARSLARFHDPELVRAGAGLPGFVTLLEAAELGELDAPSVKARWQRAVPERSLPAPLGMTEDGPLIVDLVNDGPHGLVAGTTGSGKSELLRSLIAGMALNVGPEHLTFVLIDYKGGSAFDRCSQLPHVVGMVTDLDEHLGQRALICLEAELHYREERLRAAGAEDIKAYLQGDNPPLPRMVIVIDEFAAMASSLPDFMRSLVDIAQRGRSLGVHMILATQRPAGVVNDNIRANTNLRLSLRVQSVSDSTDVIGDAAAARIPRSQPGRGLLRLGPGELVVFQTALSGAPVGKGPSIRTKPVEFSLEPGSSGAMMDGRSSLDVIVDAVLEAAEGLPAPRPPWPDLLPLDLDVESLGAEISGMPVGALDVPERQRRDVFSWDLTVNWAIYGMPGSGPTALLETVVRAAAASRTVGDLNVYGLDFRSLGLEDIADLPHVGSVVAGSDGERRRRLLRTLNSEIDRRRSGASGPTTLLLVDGLETFINLCQQPRELEERDQLQRILVDGPAVGITTVVTSAQVNGVPTSMASVIAERLVFRMADAFDYRTLGVSGPVPELPFGRGITGSGHLLQIATVGYPQGLGSASRERAPAIRLLPSEVKLADLAGEARSSLDECWMPIGIGDMELSPVGVRLGPGDHFLVAGPAQSGKSTTLEMVTAAFAGCPQPPKLWAVAPRSGPLRASTHLDGVVTDPAQLPEFGDADEVMVLVDDAEMVDDPGGIIASLCARRLPGVHVVAAGRADALRGLYSHWTKEVRRSRLGLSLRPVPEADGDLWQIALPRGPGLREPGRGYLVANGEIELVQVALVR